MDARSYWPYFRLRGGHPASKTDLFRAIVLMRWLALVLGLIGYLRNLSSHELPYGQYVPAWALAAAYTLVLTLLSVRFRERHITSPVFVSVDYAVSFVLLSLTGAIYSHGASVTPWTPMYLFAISSAMVVGLRGTWTSGLAGSIGLAAVFAVALYTRGVTYERMVASDTLSLAIAYAIEFVIISVVWAYTVGLLDLFNDAMLRAAEGRKIVQAAQRELEEREAELQVVLDARTAILTLQDREHIAKIVRDGLSDIGYAGSRVWTVSEGLLRPLPAEEGVAPLDTSGDHLVARAWRHCRRILAGLGTDDSGSTTQCAAVPIRGDDHALGVLEVRREGPGFSFEDLERIELIADQLALAGHHVDLFESGRRDAMNSERDRIAHEINDTAVQRVSGAEQLAATLALENRDGPQATELERLSRRVSRSLRDLRIALLNWDSLGWELPLADMAERYLWAFGDISGVSVSLGSSGVAREIEPERARHVLGMLQECVTSAWRVAHPVSIAAQLTYEPRGMRLKVTDDGEAPRDRDDPDLASRLRRLRRRAHSHLGEVALAEATQGGTELRVWLPW